ncbi:MAG: hypothetical protein FGM52_05780 [Mycobacterium sp.]|nr:hypothetical protein [Mycobacterium sp.]
MASEPAPMRREPAGLEASCPPGRAVDFDAVPDEASEALEPVDPPEPVLSAKATGTDTTAEPTPRATAKAPTRPM